MKKMLIILLLFLSQTIANTPKEKVIREILTELKYQEKLKNAYEFEITNLFAKKLNVSDEIKNTTFRKLYGLDFLKPMVKTWSSRFSKSELNEILKFVRTKTGKKYFLHQAEVQQEITGAGAVLGFSLYEYLNKQDPQNFPLSATLKTLKNKIKR
jgi:hypothetical protein